MTPGTGCCVGTVDGILVHVETSFPEEEEPGAEVRFRVHRFLGELAPAEPTLLEDRLPWEAESECLSAVHGSPWERAPARQSVVHQLHEEPPAAGREADILRIL